jgi:cytidylate kinase
VNTEVAARRILADPNRNSEQYGSLEEAVEKIRARKDSENARFLKKYGADCGNMANFDLVIDTTDKTPETVADTILQALRNR